MTKTRHFLIGIFLYTLLLLGIMNFDVKRMFDFRSIVAVLVGMCLLTAFQWRRVTIIDQVLSNARWNVFFAGLLTTLLSLLSSFDSTTFVPLIYGSILFLILDWLIKSRDTLTSNNNVKDKLRNSETKNPYDVQVATRLLQKHDFTTREIHVAYKIMLGQTNKEIADQLFISEQTVKKHIQNMFKKCEAIDRQSFIKLYLKWLQSDDEI